MNSSALSFINDSDTRFVKDPNLTFLVVLDSQEQIEDIKDWSPGQHQAYFFVAQQNIGQGQGMLILEVQRYSRSVIEVLEITSSSAGEVKWIRKDPLSRRTNLKGISIRGSIREKTKVNGSLTGFFGELLTVFQRQLNFTLDPVPHTGYGSKSSNGSWNGDILQLMNNKLDFSKLKIQHFLQVNVFMIFAFEFKQ